MLTFRFPVGKVRTSLRVPWSPHPGPGFPAFVGIFEFAYRYFALERCFPLGTGTVFIRGEQISINSLKKTEWLKFHIIFYADSDGKINFAVQVREQPAQATLFLIK